LTGSTIWYLLVCISFFNSWCFSQIDMCAQQHLHQCALARGPAATILNRLRQITFQASRVIILMNLSVVLNYQCQSAAPAVLCASINFCCQHENNSKHDDLDTRTANDWHHLKPGTSSVVCVVRNVDSQLARGDLSCRRKLLLHNKFTTNINRRPVKSGNYSPSTPGISRSSG
jgi:hypothetical protein